MAFVTREDPQHAARWCAIGQWRDETLHDLLAAHAETVLSFDLADAAAAPRLRAGDAEEVDRLLRRAPAGAVAGAVPVPAHFLSSGWISRCGLGVVTSGPSSPT